MCIRDSTKGTPLTAAQLGNCFYQDGDPDQTPITSGMLKDGDVYTGSDPWPAPPAPPAPPVTPDTAVALDKTELSLEPGQTAKLKAALTPADATYKYCLLYTSISMAVARGLATWPKK